MSNRVIIDEIDCNADLIDSYRDRCARLVNVRPISGTVGWIKAAALLCDEVERLQRALHLACTPPWPQHQSPLGLVDETLLHFWLRRAAEAAKGGEP